MTLTQALVLFGGPTAEHEISVLSARFIVRSLDRARFTPLLVGISRCGSWHRYDEAALLAIGDDARHARVDTSGPRVTLAPPATAGAAATLLTVDGSAPPARVDVAFPVMHGPFGEDGCVQGMLEVFGVPYVGAGVLGSAVGMDKAVQKAVLAHAELPIVPYRVFRRAQWAADRAAVVEACAALGALTFVKPANMGSSVGVRRARSEAELAAAIDQAFELDHKVVIERGLQPVREIECAVLGNDEPEVAPPGEIVVRHPDGFYSYEAKYLSPDGADLIIPADLSPGDRRTVELTVLRTYRTLEGAGLARVDLFLTPDHEVYVNEVNTMPGFTAISMYPRMWAAAGVTGELLVTRLLDLAVARHQAAGALRLEASELSPRG